MTSFVFTQRAIFHAYNGRALKSFLRTVGLGIPATVTDMYLRHESPEYIHAAALAIMQIGE